MSKYRFDFRDVSTGLKMLREFLLGRKHNLHGRFPPNLASRTIPPPDIPRGPEYRYADQYYHKRHAMNAVKPPVEAPIAQGPAIGSDPTKKAVPGGLPPGSICFSCAPTPGFPWWWDGHCYFEHEADPCPPPCPPCTPSPPCPPCK